MNPSFLKFLADFDKIPRPSPSTLAFLEGFSRSADLARFDSLSRIAFANMDRIDQLSRLAGGLDFHKFNEQSRFAMERFLTLDQKVLSHGFSTLRFAEQLTSRLQEQLRSPGYLAFIDSVARVPSIQTSFLSELTGKLNDLALELKPDVDASTIAEISDAIADKTEALPRGTISFEGMIQIILNLVAIFISLFIYADTKEDASQQRKDLQQFSQRIDRLGELQNALVSRLTPLIPDSSSGTFYIVRRQAYIRIHPSSKSRSVAKIYPNQKVLLLERRHKWIFVQYFDYLDSQVRTGWVDKKYLERVSQ